MNVDLASVSSRKIARRYSPVMISGSTDTMFANDMRRHVVCAKLRAVPSFSFPYQCGVVERVWGARY